MEQQLQARASETEQVEEAIHLLETEIARELQNPLKASQQRRATLEESAALEQGARDELLQQIDDELEAELHACINHQEETSSALVALEAELKLRVDSARKECEVRLEEMRELKPL